MIDVDDAANAGSSVKEDSKQAHILPSFIGYSMELVPLHMLDKRTSLSMNCMRVPERVAL